MPKNTAKEIEEIFKSTVRQYKEKPKAGATEY